MEGEPAALTFFPCPVPPDLAPDVTRITGFRDVDIGLVRRELLVVGCPMMLSFGGRYRLSERDAPSRPSRTVGSFFAGPYDTFTTSENLVPGDGIQIDFTPIGARRFLGLPMTEVANRVVGLDDVLPRDLRGLEDRLAALSTWDARFSLVCEILRSRLGTVPSIAPEMKWAWDQLVRSHGTGEVDVLAGEVQWSRKRLRDRFLSEVGFPPKLVARMLRYRHAVDLAMADPHRSWAAIAVDAGYYDQAHLHRDVRAFAGVTPGALRAELAAGTYFQDLEITVP